MFNIRMTGKRQFNWWRLRATLHLRVMEERLQKMLDEMIKGPCEYDASCYMVVDPEVLVKHRRSWQQKVRKDDIVDDEDLHDALGPFSSPTMRVIADTYKCMRDTGGSCPRASTHRELVPRSRNVLHIDAIRTKAPDELNAV